MKVRELHFDHYQTTETGKVLGSSKKSHSWTFSVNGHNFDLLATESYLSKTFRVYLNNEEVLDTKLRERELFHGIRLCVEELNLKFRKVNAFLFDLFIEGELFIPRTSKTIGADARARISEVGMSSSRFFTPEPAKGFSDAKQGTSRHDKFLEYEDEAAPHQRAAQKPAVSATPTLKKGLNETFSQVFDKVFATSKKSPKKSTKAAPPSPVGISLKESDKQNPQLKYMSYNQNISDNIPKPAYYDFYFAPLKTSAEKKEKEARKAAKKSFPTAADLSAYSHESFSPSRILKTRGDLKVIKAAEDSDDMWGFGSFSHADSLIINKKRVTTELPINEKNRVRNASNLFGLKKISQLKPPASPILRSNLQPALSSLFGPEYD